MALDVATATAVARDLTVTFDSAVAATNPFYPTLALVRPTSRQDERYGWVGSFPGVREFLGDRKFNDLRAADFTLENKAWESSLMLNRHTIADDFNGMLRNSLELLGRKAAYHPDTLLFQLIVNGESTTIWDGQYFFDTDHSWGDSGSQSNDLTYPAATGTTPTAAEFKAAYHQARRTMLGYKDDRGDSIVQPVVTGMSGMVIVLPLALEEVAREALTAELSGGGDSNIVLDRPQIVASPLLTDATKFYVFHVDGIMKPFVFQARSPLTREVVGLDSIETKHAKFMTEARYNLGYLGWWAAVLTTFT